MAVYNAGEAGIKIRPNLSGFKRELESGLKGIRADLTVTVDADTSRASADIQAWRRREGSTRVSAGVNADTGIASAQLSTWRKAEETRWVKQQVVLEKSSISKMDSDLRGAMGKLPGAGKVNLIVAVSGAVGAVAALMSVANAAAQVAKAGALLPAIGFGGLAGITAVGTGVSGIGGVFSAMKAETEAAGSAASSAADQVHEIASAQWDLEDAQRGVQSANRDAVSAQQDLNDVYRDTSRNLRDVNNELNEQKLATEESSLAVEDAEERLNRVNNDPSSSGRDKRKAQIDYEQAIARLQDERNATVDLQADTDKANADGVAGSKAVIDATQRVADAQQAQADALHRVEEAQYALQQAQEGDGGSGAADKLAAAMEKLSPHAKEFVTDIRALGPAWTELRKADQDALFEGLGASVTNLSDAQLPILKAGLVGISSEINDGLRGSIDVLSSDMARLDFAVSLGNTRRGFAGLADAAAPFTEAMIKTTAVGTTFFPAFGQAVSDASTKFDMYITKASTGGVLKQSMQEGVDAAKDLGSAIYNVGSVTASVFRAAGAGHDGLKTFNDLAGDLADKLKSVEGQDTLITFFEEGRDALDDWRPVLASIPGLLGGISDGVHTWAGIVLPVVGAIGNLMADHPALVEAAVVAYLGFKTIGPILGVAQAAMGKLIATTAGTAAATAGAGRLQAAGAGLLGVIGNPYVLAAAGAAIATYGFVQSMNEGSDAVARFKTQQIQMAEANDGLTKALQMSGGAIDSSVLDKQAEVVDQFYGQLTANAKDAPGLFDDLAAGTALAFSKVSGGIGEGVVANHFFRESLNEVSEAAKESYDELGMTSGDLSKALTGSQPAFEALIDKVRDTSNGGEDLRGKLVGLRAQFNADRLEAYYAASEAFTAIGAEAGTAATQISALTDAMDAQNREANAVDDARLKAAEAQANLLSGLDKGKAAPIIMDDGRIDFTNDNGRTLQRNMQELQTGYANLIASTQRLARERGESDEEAVRTTKKVADEYLETARQQLLAAGIPLPAIDLLFDHMSLIPSEVNTTFNADTKPATDKLVSLQTTIDNFKRINGVIPIDLQIASSIANPNDKSRSPNIVNPKQQELTNQITSVLPGNAHGGFLPTTGPGTEITDGIVAVNPLGVPIARVDGGEHITNRPMSEKYSSELTQINAGTFPKFADGGVLPGGYQPTDSEQAQLGGAPVATSIWTAVKSQFPGAILNSAMTDHDVDGGLHPKGQAIDIGGPMQSIAEWLYGFRDQLAMIIWDPMPSWYNMGGTQAEGGAARALYGEGTMAQHANHVHAGAEGIFAPNGVSAAGVGVDPATGAALNTGTTTTSQVTYDQAPLPGMRSDDELSLLSNQASVDSANQERNKVYADPMSTAADKQAADIAYQQAQNTLQSSQEDADTSALSVPGMFSKAGAILGTGLLSFFGLENSVLSEGNVYNQAVQDVAKQYGTPSTTGGYAYQPKNLPATVTTYTPAPGVAQPGVATAPGVTSAAGMPTDVPEGGIAAGSPGAKEAFWNEWGNRGWQAEELWFDTLRLFNGESSWNETAQNPGSTAYGIGQFLDSTRAQYPGYGDTAASQAPSVAQYLMDRPDYGDPSTAYAMWQSRNPHWYDQGGVANGIGLMAKNIIAPERTLTPRQTETYDSMLPLLESLNRSPEWSSGSLDSSVFQSPSGRGGSVSYDHSTHLHDTPIMDYGDMLHELDRRGAMAMQGTLGAHG